MKHIYGIDSIFGNGQDFFDENGKLIGYSIDSAISGKDFYAANGQQMGHSVDSIIGNGQDIYICGMEEQGFRSAVSQEAGRIYI